MGAVWTRPVDGQLHRDREHAIQHLRANEVAADVRNFLALLDLADRIGRDRRSALKPFVPEQIADWRIRTRAASLERPRREVVVDGMQETCPRQSDRGDLDRIAARQRRQIVNEICGRRVADDVGPLCWSTGGVTSGRGPCLSASDTLITKAALSTP